MHGQLAERFGIIFVCHHIFVWNVFSTERGDSAVF